MTLYIYKWKEKGEMGGVKGAHEKTPAYMEKLVMLSQCVIGCLLPKSHHRSIITSWKP